MKVVANELGIEVLDAKRFWGREVGCLKRRVEKRQMLYNWDFGLEVVRLRYVKLKICQKTNICRGLVGGSGKIRAKC